MTSLTRSLLLMLDSLEMKLSIIALLLIVIVLVPKSSGFSLLLEFCVVSVTTISSSSSSEFLDFRGSQLKTSEKKK